MSRADVARADGGFVIGVEAPAAEVIGLSCYRRRGPLRVTCRDAGTATSYCLPRVATPEWVVGRGAFATDLGGNHDPGGRDGRWSGHQPCHKTESVGFAAAGGAVVVAGLFRNHGQPSHLIHSLASFAAPIVLVATILGCRLTVADLGRRFDRLSVAILIVSVGLFVAAYPAHLVPYALMELICFALIGAWIWLLEARLQDVIVQL
jgi:hypothetical protein